MPQQTFLESTASGYASHYAGTGILQNTCFVFPNKRAGTFFLKALREVSSKLEFAPMVTTISDLVTDLSDRNVNNRLDTLFLLHKCYVEIVSPHLTEEGKKEYLTFDAFRRWGETVLSDFNEVDIHLAPADDLFKNLFDFRSIASTFLTQEQRDLMEEYFGYKLSKQYDDDKFWLEFGERYASFDGTDNKEITDETPRSRFIHIWKVLSPLYERFHKALAEKGLTSSGGAYRLAIDNLEEAIENGSEALNKILPFKKMVFIGFNALSMSERKIFMLLRSLEGPVVEGEMEPFADFVWDCTGPILSPRREKTGKPNSPEQDSARRFIAMNMKEFPAPDWMLPYLYLSRADSLPESIRIVSSPSKAMQVKIASELIGELKKEVGDAPFEEADVALVLPDESLLLPMLYAMPDNIGPANLTMGYPLKLTSVTSLLVLLRRMQLFRRDSSNYKGYTFDEVSNLLSHPYAQSIVGSSAIRKFISLCRKHHVSVVTDEMIKTRLNEKAYRLMRPLDPATPPQEVIEYLDEVLELVDRAISNRGSKESVIRNARIERANVSAWRLGLARLADAIEEYGVKLSMAGTMAEAYRLIQCENVPFEGEPLRGLQVMGTLETRALDFKHVYIVALNDRTLPGRARQRSFLPNVLRRAYGLPPVNYSESLFAYYFYRMISRAKNVTLIYDNRVSGLTGGPSRYLMQLDKLYARGHVEHIDYSFKLTTRSGKEISVEKTDEVMETLDRFLTIPQPPAKPEKLSASALKRYIKCPLKFYLQVIKKLRDDPAPINAVDPITYGNLIHTVMEKLYIVEPDMRGKWLDHPIRITSEFIDSLIIDKERIADLIHHQLNKSYYHLEEEDSGRPLQPDTFIIKETALNHILNILRHDRKLTPFNLYGCEVRVENLQYPLGDMKINMTYAIDRIDDAECEGNISSIRIVDYKTGNSHITAPSFDSVFNGSSLSDNYFQLQLYAHLFNLHRLQKGEKELSIKPVIYPVPSIHKKLDSLQKEKFYPKIGNEFIEWHDGAYGDSTVDQLFADRLNEMLSEIFDPKISFDGIYESEKCRYCAFKSICSD